MLTIRFDGFGPGEHAHATASPTFRFCRDGKPHTIVRLVITDEADARLGGHEPEDLEAAFMRFAVPRIQALDVPDEYTDRPQFIRLEPDDVPEVLAYLRQKKECRYQVTAAGHDLLCSAASDKDETLLASAEGRRLAPTTRAICSGCQLPSTDVLCSHFSHPQVVGTVTVGGGWRRSLGAGLCELGHRLAFTDGGNCRPNGHDCWERSMRAPDISDDEAVEAPPLAVTEALDFLDLIWERRFRRKLLRGLPLTVAAGLAMPVRTRDDFKARMSDLSGAFDAIDVADDLLPPEAMVDGRLNRMKAALGVELEGIKTLQAVLRIRTALQHPGAVGELHEKFELLGIAYPPKDWSDAWKRICARVVAALTEIRDEVRRESA